MHYFDPSRPTISNGALALCAADGSPLVALQVPEFRPQRDGTWLVVAWLPVASNTAREHTCELGAGGAGLMLESWRVDPEAAFRDVFGWAQPHTRWSEISNAEPVQRTTASAKDLGL